jgi:hypothetical protein
LDGNSILGTANVICESNTVCPSYFIADCYPGQNGERLEMECQCCTTCCLLDNDVECNNKAWTINVDPVWMYGYVRPSYLFNIKNAPFLYSKEGDVNDREGGDTVLDPLP